MSQQGYWIDLWMMRAIPSDSARLVYAHIEFRQRLKNGCLNEPIATINKALGFGNGPNRFRRAIAKLDELGLLKLKETGGGKGCGRFAVYKPGDAEFPFADLYEAIYAPPPPQDPEPDPHESLGGSSVDPLIEQPDPSWNTKGSTMDHIKQLKEIRFKNNTKQPVCSAIAESEPDSEPPRQQVPDSVAVQPPQATGLSDDSGGGKFSAARVLLEAAIASDCDVNDLMKRFKRSEANLDELRAWIATGFNSPNIRNPIAWLKDAIVKRYQVSTQVIRAEVYKLINQEHDRIGHRVGLLHHDFKAPDRCVTVGDLPDLALEQYLKFLKLQVAF